MATRRGTTAWTSWRFGIRAVAGFGRHGRLHQEHFFELAGDLPIEARFVLSEEEADRLVEHVRQAGLNLFSLRTPVDSGFTGQPAP